MRVTISMQEAEHPEREHSASMLIRDDIDSLEGRRQQAAASITTKRVLEMFYMLYMHVTQGHDSAPEQD